MKRPAFSFVLGLVAFLFAVGAQAEAVEGAVFTQGTYSSEIPISARTRKGADWRKTWDLTVDWKSFQCGEHRLSFERFHVRGRNSELASRDLSEGTSFGWDQAPVAWDWRLPLSVIPWRWSRDQRNVVVGIEPDAKGQPAGVRLCGIRDGHSSDCEERLHGQGMLIRTGESRLNAWGGRVELPVEGASMRKSTRWVGAFAIAPNSEVVARFAPASVELAGIPSVELRGRMQGWSSFQVRGRLPLVDDLGGVSWKDVEIFGPAGPMTDSDGRLSFGVVSEATRTGLGGRNLGFYSVNRCD